MSRRRDGIKMTFLSKKYEELVLLDAIQNFSATMLPFFNSEHCPFFTDLYSSIMSGDSPTSTHKENAFNYDTPGRSSPPPTTSYLASKHETQPQPPAIDSTAVAEPAKEEKDKEKEKDGKDEGEFGRPDANPGYKPDTDKKPDAKKGDSKDGGGGGGDKKSDKPEKKANGIDKLDGKWVPPADEKPDEDGDEKEDSCIVNCLYYTLQCCECTIT